MLLIYAAFIYLLFCFWKVEITKQDCSNSNKIELPKIKPNIKVIGFMRRSRPSPQLRRYIGTKDMKLAKVALLQGP